MCPMPSCLAALPWYMHPFTPNPFSSQNQYPYPGPIPTCDAVQRPHQIPRHATFQCPMPLVLGTKRKFPPAFANPARSSSPMSFVLSTLQKVSDSSPRLR